MTDAELVTDLMRPEAYPEGAGPVTLAETHISWVFLAERRVYKVKKPVRFPFLDYGTLDKRRHACEEEVRLNRRLAPEVYLGVCPVTRGADGRLRVGGDGDPVEYCVAMRRLPARRLLDGLIRRGEVPPQASEQLLDVLLPFYAAAARGPEVDGYASPEALDGNVRDNLAVLSAAEHGLAPGLQRRVRSSQLQYLHLHEKLFRQRLARGFVCEGHGDLRPEHVCLGDGAPVVFDCVEFSLPLRVADVASELAFLAMECHYLGGWQLAEDLLRDYRRRSGDDVPDGLVNFYKAYRACIRGKVELLRAAQQAPPEEVTRGRQRAERYLHLASYYAAEFHRAKLFVLVGASGTGKSTVARGLGEALGAEVLRSDAIRHELAGGRDPGAGYRQGIYALAVTQKTYDLLLERAAARLRDSVSVALDGSFLDPDHRLRARELAQQAGADVHFLVCTCPRDTARGRVRERRRQSADISDASPEIVEFQERQLAAADDLTGAEVVRLDTRAGSREVLAEVLRQLQLT